MNILWEFLRCYKQKVFSLLKPDHYHCKGSYDYYIQVSPSLRWRLLKLWSDIYCQIQVFQPWEGIPPKQRRALPLSGENRFNLVFLAFLLFQETSDMRINSIWSLQFSTVKEISQMRINMINSFWFSPFRKSLPQHSLDLPSALSSCPRHCICLRDL